MSCLSVKFTPIGGISSALERIGGMDDKLIRIGGMNASLTRLGGITTKLERKGGITCRFYQECSSGIGQKPYLEIAPTVVWVLAGWTSNDVYSNTDWNID